MADSLIKVGTFLIAVLGVVLTLVINRERLQSARLKVEIVDNSLKVNHRPSGILDFQMNLRIQAINGRISFREISLLRKRVRHGGEKIETFRKATNVGGDLTNYNEEDFTQFLSCLLVGFDCSKILEYESRFRKFFQLEELILEKEDLLPLRLLGRIQNYQPREEFFLQFDYDLNGFRKKLFKKLDLKSALGKSYTLAQ